jgi:hypothetical protein
MFIDSILDKRMESPRPEVRSKKVRFKDQARGGGAAGIKSTPGGFAAFEARKSSIEIKRGVSCVAEIAENCTPHLKTQAQPSSGQLDFA